MEADAGRNRALCAIAGTIARPGATFRAISGDPDSYRASSVAVFAAVCLVSVLPSTTVWFESDGAHFLGFGSAVREYAISLIDTVPRNFLLIGIIFVTVHLILFVKPSTFPLSVGD